MADIDILEVDVLLIIFNFLSLYDKLMTMRVCKKWHTIIKDTHAWKVIDLNEQGPVIGHRKSTCKRYIVKLGQDGFTYLGNEIEIRWKFPRNPRDILAFLKLFAGAAMQKLFLTVMTSDIMEFLRTTCPNIIALEFVEWACPTWPLRGSLLGTNIMLHVSPELTRLCLNLDPCYNLTGSHEQRESQERILSVVAGNCSSLRQISLYGLQLTSTGMKNIAKIDSLREIELMHCYEDAVGYETPDEILIDSIGCLTKLICFKIHALKPFDMVDFLTCIGKWEHLKVLSLQGVWFSEEAFEMMIPGLLNVEKLHLSGPVPRAPFDESPITSHVVTLIVNYLKKMKTLVLSLSDDVIMFKSLRYHQTLETLTIEYSHTMSFYPFYNMLLTLPKIKYAKICSKHLFNKSNITLPITDSTEIWFGC
ncbi:uncharacterized protein [Amphiura filiformis]|uniref:uncharacterized protein n=1 Tax=Amphiura filiformis TaxID=82378 RepID=UPI003B216F5E